MLLTLPPFATMYALWDTKASLPMLRAKCQERGAKGKWRLSKAEKPPASLGNL